ncbi:unnamed protein product [Arctogadus glacialis]
MRCGSHACGPSSDAEERRFPTHDPPGQFTSSLLQCSPGPPSSAPQLGARSRLIGQSDGLLGQDEVFVTPTSSCDDITLR